MAGVDPVPVALRRLADDPAGAHQSDDPGDGRPQGSRLGVTRPSGNPRKVTSVTPTARAASSCSSRRMAAISVRLMEWSEPPASPSVAMQYATSIPRPVQVATEPAAPKSTSSGWAVTTRIRSTSSDPSSTVSGSGGRPRVAPRWWEGSAAGDGDRTPAPGRWVQDFSGVQATRSARRGSLENISTMGIRIPMRVWMRSISRTWFHWTSDTTSPAEPARAVRPERCR